MGPNLKQGSPQLLNLLLNVAAASGKPKQHSTFMSNKLATFADKALGDLSNHIVWDDAWTFGWLRERSSHLY